MAIDYTPVLPVVNVGVGGMDPLKTFVGEGAIERAQDFIGSMPNPEDGRFYMDVSDDYCAECGKTFSAEAWEPMTDDAHNRDRNKWACPECGARDRRNKP